MIVVRDEAIAGHDKEGWYHKGDRIVIIARSLTFTWDTEDCSYKYNVRILNCSHNQRRLVHQTKTTHLQRLHIKIILENYAMKISLPCLL